MRRGLGVLVVVLISGIAVAEPAIDSVSFHPPTDSFRFYHARVALGASATAFVVSETSVAGQADLFVATVDGALHQLRDGGGVSRASNGRVPADKASVFYVRFPWRDGATYAVRLAGQGGDGGEAFTLEASAAAPDTGGFPFPGWQKHRVLVLREDFGVPRTNEPFLFFLSDEGRHVKSWARELRVAALDPATNTTREVPSQVIYEKRRLDTPAQQAVYTTAQAAILADVPANGKAYYVIAYGNPDAPAPAYDTDLETRRGDDGATWVSNAYFEAELDAASGQLSRWRSKVYGVGDDRGFGMAEKPHYQIHYNPDAWVKGRSWTHTHGWNPPPKQTIQAGPIVVVTRRWGHLPRAREIEVEVVYHFFSQSPYCLIESTMDVTQDVVVSALRNEEVVFAPAEDVDHAGWRDANGELGYRATGQGEGLTPGLIKIIEADAPYVCLTRESSQLGMASLRLSQHAGSRGDAPPVLAATQTILADYGWGFRYWSRALVYPWGDFIPDQPAVLNAGTYYGERSALCLFPLESGPEPAKRLAYLEDLYGKLANPIRVDHQGAGPW